MKIWVDADACPVVIKDILFRAAKRTKFPLTLVANRFVKIPDEKNIHFLLVRSGPDEADMEIAAKVSPGDLVITEDIPMAANVIENGGIVLSPRGELFTGDNIRTRLSIRDFMETLRAGGVDTGGPSSISQNDRKSFADNLDKILTKFKKPV